MRTVDDASQTPSLMPTHSLSCEGHAYNVLAPWEMLVLEWQSK
jgi:hypothetical protein